MEQIFADIPQAIANTPASSRDRVQFSLENLGYHFPTYRGMDPPAHGRPCLREQTYAGARHRFPRASTAKCAPQLDHELDLIIRLGISGYFLIVWDIVRYYVQNNIMVQGRGSAANAPYVTASALLTCDPFETQAPLRAFPK